MTIVKADSSLAVDTKSARGLWCVFEHLAQFVADKPPEVIFVSVCKLSEVYRLIEGVRNSEWNRIFAEGGTVMVRIVATTEEKHEAQRYAVQHMRTLEKHPRCNLHGVLQHGRTRPIMEIESKIVYASQTDAASKLAISASAISRHLNGQLSHVNGYTFEYKA